MKKVLAWAVALALVLSSFTMAFAADAPQSSKDFSDADQIHYTEAVDVMVATGIINGFPDGTFGPQKTVQRDQMAKMIACIMNGGEDVGNQYKSACPFADSQSSWAAGYIAYCASEHIIDGRSADVFDPTATVTGTEVAKMALTSLGYDSKIQGYTGDTWAANVLKDAKKKNLFEGLDSSFVPGDPCDRESAAQILFNMLKAAEVNYPMNMSVSTGDTSVTVSGEAVDIENSGDGNDNKLNLYEDVFGGKLTLNKGADAADDFGRPAHNWTYPDEDTLVGEYPDTADYEFTVEDATSMAKAIEAYDKDLAKKITENSVKINGQTEGKIALGDKVELFVKDKKYDAVVTQYKPYQITKVDTNTKKFTPEEVEKGITAKLTLEGGIAADNTMAGYDAEAYVKDAIIAVALGAEDKILDSYVPEELASGKVTKTKADKVTIDGTEYEPSAKPLKLYGEDTSITVGHEYTIYDYNGYMFAAELVAAPTPEEFYGLVTKTKTPGDATPGEWDQDDPTPDAAKVQILTPEGNYETFALAEDYTSIPEPSALVKYVKNDDGTIKIVDTDDTKLGPTGEAKAEPVKTGGVLYGKQLSENVAAFANIGTDKPEWKVYSFADLEAATAITVNAYFEEKDGIVAMKVDSLEAAKQDDVVLAILTKATPIQNDTGNAYDLDVFENGKATTYTTVGDNKDTKTDYDSIKAYVDAQRGIELVKLTKDGDLVKGVTFAQCKASKTPVSDFGDDNAVIFGTTVKATENIYKVLGTSDTYLNVGTASKIDNQTVTDNAVVLYAKVEGTTVTLEESEYDNIVADNYVILMQLDPKSASWDTVIYTDAETLPAGCVVVNQ